MTGLRSTDYAKIAPIHDTDLHHSPIPELNEVRLIDYLEHLQREGELPRPDQVPIGRLFAHYASCGLSGAGMPAADVERVQDGADGMSPRERWSLIGPWYR
jgi:hypothetical protein